MIQNIILVSKLALCDCASLTLELHKLLPRQGPQNPFYFGWVNLKNVVKLLRGKAFTSSRSRLTIMSPYYKLCLLWLRLYIKVILICISTKMSPLFTKYPIRLALSHLALTGLQPLSLGHSHFNPGSLNSQNMTTDWFDCVILNQVTGNMNILIVKRSSLWYRIQGLYLVYEPITDHIGYRRRYGLFADISVLPISKMLIGIGYRYRPIRTPISVTFPIC